jgi:hypothetical protein
MKSNMGATDRVIRIIIAVIIGILYFENVISGTIAYILLGIALVFLLTSFIGSCPLYSVFGINTCRIKKQGKSSV